MSRETRTEFEPDFVTPPGETLKEILGHKNMTQVELARRTDRTPKLINEVIKAKARVTPDLAIELERVLGIPGNFWNERQKNYDEFLAKEKEIRRLSKGVEWAKRFPYAKMSKLGWVPQTTKPIERLQNLLSFFGVANMPAWEWSSKQMRVAYRKSVSVPADEYSLSAWLRRGEILAQQLQCSPFSLPKFRASLHDIRSLTEEPLQRFQSKLIEICARCGVAVVFVHELPKSASGATRWLSRDKALLQLSLRYKTDDHLWFTFFHEAAHIILHRDQKKRIFIEGKVTVDQYEDEANEFASELLIPSDKYRAFLQSRRDRNFSKSAIRAFSSDLGIAPGIVVGRLQHDKHLPQTHCNDLKRRFKWKEE